MSTEGKNTSGRWAPDRRLEFIEFRLLWERTINRSELVEFFGVSPQQASADIARYLDVAPGNVEYDRRAKTYRAASGFMPRLIEFSSQNYLDQLAAVAREQLPVESSLIGWIPPCDVLRLPVRTVSPQTLLEVQSSIAREGDLQIDYQSMRRPESALRWIAPQALANDGLRWHARAWCYESGAYKDFVLSRMNAVRDRRPRHSNLPTDVAWHSQIEIVVRPRSGLSKSQRAATESEYGMQGGRLTIRCRRAMAFYLLRLLHLESSDASAPLAQQPLEVDLTEELAEVIAAARKSPAASTIDGIHH